MREKKQLENKSNELKVEIFFELLSRSIERIYPILQITFLFLRFLMKQDKDLKKSWLGAKSIQ